VGLNAVFLVVTIFIAPGFPLDDILYVVSTLFSPIVNTPGTTFLSLIILIPVFSLLLLLTLLAMIIPPLVAAIIGARLGDTGKISFLAWFLTAVISSVVFLLITILGQGASPYLGSMWAMFELVFGLFGAILYFLIPGIVNGFFYGCFSFLLSRE